jgi:trk system potassium uptake protein TrkH
MDILYKNKTLERLLILTNVAVTTAIIGTALLQLGFYRQILPYLWMCLILVAATFFFIIEKFIRFLNARSKRDFLSLWWYEFLFIAVLLILLFTTDFLVALAVYLLFQIITKICRTMVNLAASARSPAGTFIGSFLVIILAGAGLLMLPRCHSCRAISFVDALFTTTSATCVTGLTVLNTGSDFTIAGQTIILALIQLGGLGIVIFGAVFAMLFGQSLNIRQSAAMQDLLSVQTAGRIARSIAFVFIATALIEAAGAIVLLNMWEKTGPLPEYISNRWFCSIFHSVSAFCNAGLGLFPDNLMRYRIYHPVYSAICTLIVLGGLGFGVLENICNVLFDKIRRFLIRCSTRRPLQNSQPRRILLQTKIVLTVTAILIVTGAVMLMIFQANSIGRENREKLTVGDALFQSITARTAGFNTIDINALSVPDKMILIILMFIGGSPGGTAGGIKTVTLAIIIMACYATIRKRSEVEIFRRSIHTSVIYRAITVTMFFAVVLLSATFALAITERHSIFETAAIMFEAASALGTVGLSCGITPSLTTAGKIIIIITMLIGRLGPLTLLAVLTFNIKPARYNYPAESVVVG